MTRLFTSGFETGDLNEGGANVTNGAATVSVVTSNPTPRSGSYAFKCTQAANGTVAYKQILFGSRTEVWVRFAVHVTGLVSGEPTLALFLDSSGVQQGCLTYSASDNLLRLRQTTSSTAYLVGSTAMPVGSWNQIEWRRQFTSGTAGVDELWLNGAQIGTFSGDNSSGTAALNIHSLLIGISSQFTSSSNVVATVDDVAINDTNGSVNNGRPGDGRVLLLTPNGAGSSTQLTRGGTDTGANYSQVNELPPSMSQTVGSDVVGNSDLYTTTDLGAGVVPRLVEVIALARNADAGTGAIAPTIKSGSTVSEPTAHTLGTAATYVTSRWETDPNGSVAWTNAAVNALEVGLTVR